MFGSKRPDQTPFVVSDRAGRVAAENLPATSDLSVNEFHYLQRFGIRPLSLVMGSSIYKFVNPVRGYVDRIPWMSGSYHLNNFNRDVLAAHEAALDRLNAEARALEADAVVGMTLRRREIDSGVTELVYVGTAVAFRPDTAPRKYGVLTSFLPAQDFCALLQNGYVPVRAVVGSAMVAYIPDYNDHLLLEGGGLSQFLTGTYTNQEIRGFSHACSEVYQSLRRQYNLLLDREVPGRTVMGVRINFAHEEFRVTLTWANKPAGWSAGGTEPEAVESFLLAGTLTGTLVARVEHRPPMPVLPVLTLKN